MSFGITKTVPAKAGKKELEAMYDGTYNEYEFHMAGKPSKLNVGDFVYTIFNNQLVGRLKIKRIEGGAVNPKSGKPRSLIYVEAPGEKLKEPITRQGHRGTRYYDGSEWPG
ncbi:MAG: hypothetical protein MJE63_18260 [Proteobacteria bacterium]|nr:hypothetical protein [Pseudomonadota bacterium]